MITHNMGVLRFYSIRNQKEVCLLSLKFYDEILKKKIVN